MTAEPNEDVDPCVCLASVSIGECDHCGGDVYLPAEVDSAKIVPMICPKCAAKREVRA